MEGAYPYRVHRGEHISAKGLLTLYPLLEWERFALASCRPSIAARVAMKEQEVTVYVTHPPPLNMVLPTIPSAHGRGTQAEVLAVTSPSAAHLSGVCGPCGGMGTTAVGGTTDGGFTWHNDDVTGLPFATTALSFPTAQDGWLVAQW